MKPELYPDASIRTDTLELVSQLRTILYRSGLGVAVFSADGVLSEWNKQMESITGLSATEVLGHSIQTLEDTFPSGLLIKPNSLRHSMGPFDISADCSTGMKIPLDLRSYNGEILKVNALFFSLENGGEHQIAMVIQQSPELAAMNQNRQQVRRLEAVGRLSAYINQQPNTQLLLEGACRQILEVLETSFAVVYLFDRKGDAFSLAHVYTRDGQISVPATQAKFPGSMVDEFRGRTDGILVMQDGRKYANWFPPGFLDQIDIQSVIACTMLHEDRIVGVLAAGAARRSFSPDDVMLMQALASQLGQGIHSSLMRDGVQQQISHLRVMNQIARLALEIGSHEDMLTVLTQEISLILQSKGCYISLWDATRGLLYPAGGFGSHANEFMGLVDVSGQQTLSQAVLDTGRAMFVSNYATSPFGSLKFAFAQLPYAFLGLPLAFGDQKLGALLVEFQALRQEMGDEELVQCEAIAAQISMVVHKMFLFDQERQSRHDAEILQQVSTLVAKSANLQVAMEHILAGVSQVIPFDLGGIFRDLDGTVQLLSLYPKGSNKLFNVSHCSAVDMFKVAEFDNTEPIILDDIQSMPELPVSLIGKSAEAHSLLGMLLVARGKTIGSIILTAYPRAAFTQRHARLLQAFADQAGIALENDRLFQLSKNQARHLNTLSDIARLALKSQSSSDLLNSVTCYFVENIKIEGCSIYLWDELTQVGRLMEARGVLFPNHVPYAAIQSFIRWLLETGQPQLLDDLGEFISDFSETPQLKSLSLLCLPMTEGEKKLGALLMLFRPPVPDIRRESLSNWQQIAAQLSLALLQSLVFEQENQRRCEAETLREALARLATSLEPQEVLEAVLHLLSNVVSFNCASVILNEEQHLRTTAVADNPSGRQITQVDQQPIPVDSELFQLFNKSEGLVVIEDIPGHPHSKFLLEAFPNAHHWIGIPLEGRRGRFGYLTLARNTDCPFTKDDLRLARTFATQAAYTVEFALLFDQVRLGRERLQNLSRKLVDVQEAERRILAHELHDEIGQQLTGLIFAFDRIKRNGGESVQSYAEQGQFQVRQLMDEVREMSIRLRPSVLDDLGIEAALKWFIRRYQMQTGILVDAVLDGIDRRFETGIETAAFRVTQEALTNIARYAGVQVASVNAFYSEGHLCICVADNGKGFDMSILKSHEGSFGLTGMAERTELVGGRFDVKSVPGEGTKVTAIFPIESFVERRHSERKGHVGR